MFSCCKEAIKDRKLYNLCDNRCGIFFSVSGILYNFIALTNKEGLNMVLRA